MRRFLSRFMPYDRIRGYKPEPESPAPPSPSPPPPREKASAIDWKSLSIEIFATASRARGYLEADRADLAKKELDELQKIVDFKLSQKEPRE